MDFFLLPLYLPELAQGFLNHRNARRLSREAGESVLLQNDRAETFAAKCQGGEHTKKGVIAIDEETQVVDETEEVETTEETGDEETD